MAALTEALDRFGKPEIFNSDQGARFTAEDFTTPLRARGIAISMDGRGRCLDNVFVERLWRSLKYEEVSSFAQRRCRHESPSMSRTWQCWVERSRRATT